MSNEVAPVFGGKVNIADMKALAEKAAVAAQNNPRGGGAPNGSDYLNFSGKKGTFTIGKDGRVIENDERWVVDITSFEEGWVCWKNRKPESVRMANIYTGVPIKSPDPDELGPFDDRKGEGWYSAKALILKSLDDEDGQQGYFRINSVSGVGEMADLMEAFSERAAQGQPCWPVVCLDNEEFEAQGFLNYKPIFDVQDWLSNDQLEQLANGASIDDILEGAEEPKAIDKPVKKEPEKEPAPAARPRRSRK